MTRLLVLLGYVAASAASLGAAVDWASVVKPATKQVVRIEMLREGAERAGVCTGVVLSKADGNVITAAHCVEKPQTEALSLTVNRRHADVLRMNRILDLAVLKTALRDEQQIALADQTPPLGTDVAVIGFAFGDPKLMVQFGRIAQVLNEESNLIFVDAGVIPGDSGGALIDDQGRLVGINSRIYYAGPSHLGAAVSVEQVREFAEPFLPKVK